MIRQLWPYPVAVLGLAVLAFTQAARGQMLPLPTQQRTPPIEGMTLRIVGGREAWVQGNPAYVELGTVYDSRMNPMSGSVILEIK